MLKKSVSKLWNLLIKRRNSNQGNALFRRSRHQWPLIIIHGYIASHRSSFQQKRTKLQNLQRGFCIAVLGNFSSHRTVISKFFWMLRFIKILENIPNFLKTFQKIKKIGIFSVCDINSNTVKQSVVLWCFGNHVESSLLVSFLFLQSIRNRHAVQDCHERHDKAVSLFSQVYFLRLIRQIRTE